MNDRKKCTIWVSMLLLLAMLITVYVGVDAIYKNDIPHISDEYREKALTSFFMQMQS